MSIQKIVIVFFIFSAGVTAGYFLQFNSQSDLSETNSVQDNSIDDTKVKEIIATYIKENPQEILQSVNDYQQYGFVREIEEKASPYLSILENVEGLPYVGDKDAPIKIVEFFDYQCPHCKTNFSVVEQLLKANPNVVLAPKYLPILGDGSETDMSLYAAKAAEAARLQGKFTAMHQALLNSRVPLTTESIAQMAVNLELDMHRFHTDLHSGPVIKTIEKMRSFAADIGIMQAGTPGYIIGGKVMIGAGADALERMQGMINDAAKVAD